MSTPNLLILATGGTIAGMAGSATIEDHTGTLAAWFAEKKIDFIILRPDRFVFGAYTVDNISTAAAELSTHLNLRQKIRD